MGVDFPPKGDFSIMADPRKIVVTDDEMIFVAKAMDDTNKINWSSPDHEHQVARDNAKLIAKNAILAYRACLALPSVAAKPITSIAQKTIPPQPPLAARPGIGAKPIPQPPPNAAKPVPPMGARPNPPPYTPPKPQQQPGFQPAAKAHDEAKKPEPDKSSFGGPSFSR